MTPKSKMIVSALGSKQKPDSLSLNIIFNDFILCALQGLKKKYMDRTRDSSSA